MDLPWLVSIPVGLAVLVILRWVLWLTPSVVKKPKPILPGRGYAIIYKDAHLLYDHRYNLKGKPDMVYAKGHSFIPVELKSGRIGAKAEPRQGDLLQLAAYFILVETEWGYKPKQGQLIYSDGMFIVYNRRVLRNELLQTLKEMEQMLKNPTAFEAEPNFVKCKSCICRGTVCE